jgi:hypothetical protein
MAKEDDTIANSIHSPQPLNHLNVLSRHSMTMGDDTIYNSIQSPKTLEAIEHFI